MRRSLDGVRPADEVGRPEEGLVPLTDHLRSFVSGEALGTLQVVLD